MPIHGLANMSGRQPATNININPSLIAYLTVSRGVTIAVRLARSSLRDSPADQARYQHTPEYSQGKCSVSFDNSLPLTAS